MDRKQAQNNIGKYVIINDGDQGTYVGVLEKVIAEPRKPWRGKVKIKMIQDLPVLLTSSNNIHKENDFIVRQGTKLSISNEEIISFQQSLTEAAGTRMKQIQKEKKQINKKESELHQLLASFDLELSSLNSSPIKQDQFVQTESITYTFHQEYDSYFLIDDQFEKLELENSMLEFEWELNGKQHVGHYDKNGRFISTDGTRFTPEEGAFISINKEQFDPYFILQKELEPAALETFEKNLHYHQVTHKQIISCHNSLLVKLIHSQKVRSFKGVNFLTYKSPNGLLLVQHHYERDLQNDANDRVYDRFEFTTETGKRSIITYTNEFSI